MKEKLISKDMIRGVHPIFRGRFGNLFIKMAFSISGLNKVNAVYDGSKHLTGLAFVNDMLDKLGIIRKHDNREVLDSLKGGPFITVSNHPYGHIDGIIEISVIAETCPDFKIMVNWVLMQIDTMEEFFVGVNPFPKGNKIAEVKSSVSGVKQCLEHLEEGHPLGLFPAGGISLPSFKEPVDADWQPSVLRLIRRAKVPIVPVYISGSNSWVYQLLGFIGWRVRTVRLLHELEHKRGKTIYVRFGKPISVEEQKKYKNIHEFGKFLKAQTYALKK